MATGHGGVRWEEPWWFERFLREPPRARLAVPLHAAVPDDAGRKAPVVSSLTGLGRPDSVVRCPSSPDLPSWWRWSPSWLLLRGRPSRRRPSAAGCPPT